MELRGRPRNACVMPPREWKHCRPPSGRLLLCCRIQKCLDTRLAEMRILFGCAAESVRHLFLCGAQHTEPHGPSRRLSRRAPGSKSLIHQWPTMSQSTTLVLVVHNAVLGTVIPALDVFLHTRKWSREIPIDASTGVLPFCILAR